MLAPLDQDHNMELEYGIPTGVCEKDIPPEKNTHCKIGFQSTKSGAGEQLLSLDCMTKDVPTLLPLFQSWKKDAQQQLTQMSVYFTDRWHSHCPCPWTLTLGGMGGVRHWPQVGRVFNCQLWSTYLYNNYLISHCLITYSQTGILPSAQGRPLAEHQLQDNRSIQNVQMS